MSDRWAVVLALATAAGALAASPLPLIAAGAAMALALAARRPALVCVAAGVAASALAARAEAGLTSPVPGQGRTTVAGTATLVSDPVDVDGALKVELRLPGGRRVEAWARGAPAGVLRPRLAGERVDVAGRLSPVPERRRAYLATRHVAARMSVTRVGEWSPGGPLARLANDVRRTLARGAASLPERQRALFSGFVLGDDRGQDAGTVDDFRAAGLSHLLAVSGQNVVFVLALVAPALRLLGLRGRLVAGIAVLAGFGVLTRWEPSVLRAVAMAAVTMLASTLGRPATTLRTLALAATALLLVDPLLVRSVGFRLSCGACVGIAVLAPGLQRRRVPLVLAVPLAAQAGVAPVLLATFDGVPAASLPANLLAVPAAGPLMAWGLAAGLPAGLAGEPLASLVHLPTRLLVGWIAGVASWAARLPLSQLETVHAGVVAALVLVAVAGAASARHRVAPAWRVAAVAAAAGVCLWPLPPVAADGRPLGAGARLWSAGDRGGTTVVVVQRARAAPVLSGLRRARVRRLDVVVVLDRRRAALGELAPVLDRLRPRLVLTGDNARRAPPPRAYVIGRLRLDVTATSPRLEVRVRRCTVATCGPSGSRSARAPTTSPAAPW